MHVVYKWLTVALCLFVKSQAGVAPMEFWVLADIAQVRKEPQAGAAVLGSLTAGTSLRAKQTLQDWVYVDSVDNVSIGGWIHKSLVSETLVDENSILSRVKAAVDLKDSLKWIERLVSLAPGNIAYAKVLQTKYLALGETAKAGNLGRKIRGTEETYLARFEGEELVVIGVIDSNGDFRNLLWAGSRTETDRGMVAESDSLGTAIKKRARDLRIPLTARIWYACGETEGSGRRFHKVGISNGVAFDVEDTGTFGLSFGLAVDVFRQTYGKSFFATKPFNDIPSTGIRRKAEWDSLDWFKKKLVGEVFDTTGVYSVEFRSLDEYGFVDITMSGGVAPGYSSQGTWSQRGIFDRARKQVWPPEYSGGNEGFNVSEDDLYPRAPSRWFRFGNNPASPAYIILPFSTDPPANFRKDVEDGSRFGPYGYSLLRVKKNAARIFSVRSSNAGC